ncbi:histone H1 [Austrofundulus limnaeus]|uniref:Histone H1 n=1 Tax=Austrofundulus limnaeus TaxID=52670 RepID=A0A2I4ARR0_AUSLI|nr:PREDICTED: histone H1-like [Austrofundulus limnaeus]
MSSVIALPPGCPVRPPKKRARSQKRTVSALILKAVSGSAQRGGVSLAALKKVLKAGGYDVVKNKARIIVAIRRLVNKKSLVQTKGSGASGSFKLNKKPPKSRKRRVVRKKKPKKAKKAKRVKKAAGKAKKAPKRRRKAKSAKKAKKPAAKKTKKAKRPRKTKAKSTRTKAAAKK